MENQFLKKNGWRLLVAGFLVLILSATILHLGFNREFTLFKIRVEFFLFASILAGIASFHKKAFYISVTGMLVILFYKLISDGQFHLAEHLLGEISLADQFMDKENRQGEWGILLNLFGLLIGFSILAKLFEESHLPDLIPHYLPANKGGHFILLAAIFILSSFLDNIAAALIGGTIAMIIYRGKVHIGFIAAIVAASNAGGAGSVIGDTTTTMMWIDGVSPLNVLHAFVASLAALAVFGWVASGQQHRYQEIAFDATEERKKLRKNKLFVVLFILAGAIAANILYDMPALGVWAGILLGSLFTRIPWSEAKHTIRTTLFLLCLVFSASMMPVEELPPASVMSAFLLGFLSAFFDNIPLTKICLQQGHFDWGILAYSVGFGGSMVWFGSSAGVAITNTWPEARNLWKWVKNAWHIPISFVIGFFALYLLLGWHPADNREHKVKDCPVQDCPWNPDNLIRQQEYQIKPAE